MQRFIVLYRAPQSVAERFAGASAEEAQSGLQSWIDWASTIGDALLDPGKPLGNAVTVTAQSSSPTHSDIIGMSILQADSMSDALQLVENHHHLRWAEGCSITLLEELPIPELQASH